MFNTSEYESDLDRKPGAACREHGRQSGPSLALSSAKDHASSPPPGSPCPSRVHRIPSRPSRGLPPPVCALALGRQEAGELSPGQIQTDFAASPTSKGRSAALWATNPATSSHTSSARPVLYHMQADCLCPWAAHQTLNPMGTGSNPSWPLQPSAVTGNSANNMY